VIVISATTIALSELPTNKKGLLRSDTSSESDATSAVSADASAWPRTRWHHGPGRLGEVPALRNLNGSAASNWQHPVALVAAAATERGAGNPDGAVERLDAAAQLEQRSPTYYGAAWVALGRIMLTTSLLGECPVAG
jgi:hypothetical protein